MLAYFAGEGRGRRAVTFVGTLQDITEVRSARKSAGNARKRSTS
jgi:hypothetical protein